MAVSISAIALVLATVAQVSVLPYLSGRGVGIDLVLLLVVGWGIMTGVREGLLWGLIGGLALDAVSAGSFGVATAALASVGLLAGLSGPRLLRSSVLWPVLAAVLATTVYYGLTMALLALLGRQWEWLSDFRDVALPAAALNAMAMLPVYGLLWLTHRATEPKTKW